MTISNALKHAYQRLTNAGLRDSAWLDAELLLSHILQKPRDFLTAHSHDQLNAATIQQFNLLTLRRSQGEPIAYSTGEKEFYGLTFKVTKDVLIPRPATEELLEAIIKEQGSVDNTPHVFIDVGTGSGCIAVTLAKHFPTAQIFAVDISEHALAVARENANIHNVSDRIAFLRGDLLESLLRHSGLDPEPRNRNKKTDSVDFFPFLDSRGSLPRSGIRGGNDHACIIVANLPYVPTSTLNSKPELSFEPRAALNGGPDGTFLYRRLLNQLMDSVTQKLIMLPALLALEVDDSMASTLLASEEIASLSKWYTYNRQNHVLIFQKRRSHEK